MRRLTQISPPPVNEHGNDSDAEVACIIPARGGSKGLPRKNVRPLGGIPLIGRTIQQSVNSVRVSRTFVSTDDDEIAGISRQYGAEIIERPASISGDGATSEEALLHALKELERRESYIPDLVVFLQCTSPIRRRGDIDNAIEALISTGSDSLLSVCGFHRFIWKVENGEAVSANYDYQTRPLRQSRAPEFMENGSIYIFKPWVLTRLNNRLGGKIRLYEMDYFSSVEIDTLEDFQMCEAILELLES